MQPESAKYLEDIRDTAHTIIEITGGRNFDAYLRDKILRLAVERCFEIIGEALRQLDDRDHPTASKITDFKDIIAFRNILIHGYSLLRHERVWAVIENDLPILVAEVNALLARPSADGELGAQA